MNSGKAARDTAHREATLLASEHRCLGCRAEPPSLPAHWPHHRGMGGGMATWAPSDWVPLCWKCHEILDKRDPKPHKRDRIIINIESALERGAWPPK